MSETNSCQQKNECQSIFVYDCSQMDVGKRFKELRIKRGYPKMDQFAEEKKVGRTLVSNFENAHSRPRIDKIERMIRLLPCSLAEFFAEEDSPVREYLGSGKELIMVRQEDQVWVDRLLQILKSEDRAVIGIVQNALMMSDKVPDKTGSRKESRKNGAKISAKKESGSGQKTGTRG